MMRISDAAVEEISKIATLRQLSLAHCKNVSEASKAAFKVAHPDCVVR